MSDRKDIQAETLWDYVVQAIEDAVRLLNRAVDLLADLIRRAAALEPGQAVYQNHDSGEITIDLARST